MVIVAVGAFFGGMAASDPAASSEYRAVEKKLEGSDSDPASTQDLDDALNDLGQSERELADAHA